MGTKLVVGTNDGDADGASLGFDDGCAVGSVDGENDGAKETDVVGFDDGNVLGESLGVFVGCADGNTEVLGAGDCDVWSMRR